MIAHALAPYILGVVVLAWQATPPDTKTKAEAKPAHDPSAQKSPDERFETLLAAARKDPAKADWNAIRHAFAHTRHYHPYNVEWKNEIAKVRKDIAGGNLKAAEPALDTLLERERFMRLDALVTAVMLYGKKGDQNKARKYSEILEGLADTLFVPERGRSFEKPIVVLFIDEEHLVLRSMKVRHQAQSLHEKDGHHFDVFLIPAHGNQPECEVYFNIDMPFNAMGQSLQKAFDKAKNPEAKK